MIGLRLPAFQAYCVCVRLCILFDYSADQGGEPLDITWSSIINDWAYRDVAVAELDESTPQRQALHLAICSLARCCCLSCMAHAKP